MDVWVDTAARVHLAEAEPGVNRSGGLVDDGPPPESLNVGLVQRRDVVRGVRAAPDDVARAHERFSPRTGFDRHPIDALTRSTITSGDGIARSSSASVEGSGMCGVVM